MEHWMQHSMNYPMDHSMDHSMEHSMGHSMGDLMGVEGHSMNHFDRTPDRIIRTCTPACEHSSREASIHAQVEHLTNRSAESFIQSMPTPNAEAYDASHGQNRKSLDGTHLQFGTCPSPRRAPSYKKTTLAALCEAQD